MAPWHKFKNPWWGIHLELSVLASMELPVRSIGNNTVRQVQLNHPVPGEGSVKVWTKVQG